MIRRSFTLVLALAGLCLVALWADAACAQGGGGRRGGGGGFGGFGGRFGRTHQVTIATAPEVQANLKLTDEQKTKVADLNTKFTEARQALPRGGGGGGGGQNAEALEARNKLNAEYAKLITDALEKPQATRLQEIYVQVNGTAVLADDAIAALLKLTDDQKEKLNTVRQENGQKMLDAFQTLGQDASREERQAKTAELTKAADDAILAVLNDEQRKAWDGMKGEKLEIDLAQFQARGGRGGGGGGGGGAGGGRRGGAGN